MGRTTTGRWKWSPWGDREGGGCHSTNQRRRVEEAFAQQLFLSWAAGRGGKLGGSWAAAGRQLDGSWAAAGRQLVRTWCTSAMPISTGPPACLMELMGEAPVPPSWPLTCSCDPAGGGVSQPQGSRTYHGPGQHQTDAWEVGRAGAVGGWRWRSPCQERRIPLQESPPPHDPHWPASALPLGSHPSPHPPG